MRVAVPDGQEAAHLDIDGIIAEIMAAPEEA
jgi:hypothetical protein